MSPSRARRIWISCFVVCWIGLFHYETLRLNYLSPLLGRELPKTKFLFPPAGWIMFFNITPSYGFAEVYGFKDGRPTLIDPHRIFATRFVWYDNIRRNVMVGVLSPNRGQAFCGYLRRKFPEYQRFAVVYRQYADLIGHPDDAQGAVVYQCP